MPSQIEPCLRSCFWLVGRQWNVRQCHLAAPCQQEKYIATCGAFDLISAARCNLLSCGELGVKSGSFYAILSALNFGISD